MNDEVTTIESACPKCGGKMMFMWGCGWDYDRWLCLEQMPGTTLFCPGEIELDTTTTPEELDSGP